MIKRLCEIITKYIRQIAFLIILVIFIVLLFSTRDSNKIKKVKDFVKDNTKVLYITDKKNYSKDLVKLFDNYEVSYLYVDIETLNSFEKTKLEDIVNSKYISNIIAVYKNGKITDALIKPSSKEEYVTFLQKNYILPKKLEDISNIFEKSRESLNQDFSILYVPYIEDDIEYSKKVLNEISDEYDITLSLIPAYLLSEFQKEKLNSMLEISYVDDQIVLLISDGKIIGSIRGKNSKEDYINKMLEYKFISSKEESINYIDYNSFLNILDQENKSIIVIGKEDCKYCEDLKTVLNKIAKNYDIVFNYLNIVNFDSEDSKNVESKLLQLGYKDGFSTPILLIVENGKLLDYVVGSSNEEYFIEKFSENGIIK